MAGAGSQGVVLSAFIVSAGVAMAKLAAAGASGSSALLASTIHTLADMSAMALLLFGLWRARADVAATQAGSGDRQLVFWALAVASPIYALAAGVALFEGIERWARPNAPGFARLDQLLVGAGATLAVGYGWFALTRAQTLSGADGPIRDRLRQPANAAVLAVLIVAAGAVAGQLAALFGMALTAEGNARADALAAILIALVTMATSAAMAVEIGRQLAGAGAVEMRSEPAGADLPASSPESVVGMVQLEPEISPQIAETPAQPKAVAQAPTVPGQKPAPVARQHGHRGHGKRRR